jgi:hypothetical protein
MPSTVHMMGTQMSIEISRSQEPKIHYHSQKPNTGHHPHTAKSTNL